MRYTSARQTRFEVASGSSSRGEICLNSVKETGKAPFTAYDNKESRQQAMQAGAVAFLSKPFNDKHLLETIRATLRDDESSATTT